MAGRQAVAAALSEIQARQAALARGDVAPARPHDEDAPPRAARDEPRRAHSPPPRTRRPRRREVEWVARRVQRWRADGSVADDLGDLEFVRGASLADVRSLVQQFYPLPQRRPFAFVHPTLHVPIEEGDERNVDAADLAVLAVLALASRSSPPPPATRTATVRTVHTETRPTIHVDAPKPTPATAAVTTRPVRATDASFRARSRVESAVVVREPSPTYRDDTWRNLIVDGAGCNIVVREFEDGSISMRVHVLSGDLRGQSTSFQDLTNSRAINLLRTFRTDGRPLRFDAVGLCLSINKVGDSEDIQWQLVPKSDHPSVQPRDVLGTTTRERDRPSTNSQQSINTKTPRSHKPFTAAVPLPRQELSPHSETTDRSEKGKSASANHTSGNVHESNMHEPNNHEGSRTHPEVRHTREQATHPLTKPPFEVSLPGSPTADIPQTSEVVTSGPLPRLTHTLHPEPPQQSPGAYDYPERPSSRPCVQYVSYEEEQLHDAATSLLSLGLVGDVSPEGIDQVATGNEVPVFNEGHSARDDFETDSATPGFLFLSDEPFLRCDDVNDSLDSRSPLAEDMPSVSPTYLFEEENPSTIQSNTTEVTITLTTDDPATDSANELPLQSAILFKDPRDNFVPVPPPQDTKRGIVWNEPVLLVDLEPPAYSPAALPEVEMSSIEYTKTALGYLAELYAAAMMSDNINPAPDKGGSRANQAISPVASMFSSQQFQSAFFNYGIDHAVMSLNGAFAAVEEELSAWSDDRWDIVCNALQSHLQSALAKIGASFPSGELDMFEGTANCVADILGWERLRRVRLEVIETSVDTTFEKLAGIANKKGYRLSDNERSLLSRIIGSLATETSTELERWLADVFEVAYCLLFRSMSSGEKEKAQFAASREQRVRWIIQRMVAFEPNSLRRISLELHKVDDSVYWDILQDRIQSFRKKRQNQTRLLDTDVVVRSFVTFVSAAAAQLTRSFAKEVTLSSPLTPAPLLQRYVALMKAELDARTWESSTHDAFLRDFGLRVCELDFINKERQNRGFLRLNVSGKMSTLTHHQTCLLGSAYALHRKARWNHEDIPSSLAVHRYMFHADLSIALEFVYVRHSLDVKIVKSRWEDTMVFIEAEANNAFRLFRGLSAKKSNLLCAIGVNALHVGSLHDLVTFQSPSEAALNLAFARSVSIGYYMSRNEDFASLRITIRLHTDLNQRVAISPQSGPATNVIASLDRFVCSANEEVLNKFVAVGGLYFLVQCLDENRRQSWQKIPYGREFGARIDSKSLGLRYPRREILFFIRSVVFVVPMSHDTITEFNVALLEKLIDFRGSEGEDELANASALALAACCSGSHDPDLVENELKFPTNTQKLFLAVHGLERLQGAIESLAPSSTRRMMLEDALLTLLKTVPFFCQEGFLIHAPVWLKYFVEARAWLRSSVYAELVNYLLEHIHRCFFVQEFQHRERVCCSCGCQGFASASSETLGTVVTVFCTLLMTEKGIRWGLQRMLGPLDVLDFLKWTQVTPSAPYDLARKTLVAVFREPMLAVDSLSLACILLIPRLLETLQGEATEDLTVSCLQTVALILHWAIKLSLWREYPCGFVRGLLAVANYSTETREDFISSKRISSVVLLHERQDDLGTPAVSNARFLYIEHTTSGRQGTSSVLESIIALLKISPQADGIELLWRVPLLLAACSLASDTQVAHVCINLGIETILIDLVVKKNRVEERVLAGRTLGQLLLQMSLSVSWVPSQESTYRLMCEAFILSLQHGGRRAFTRRQVEVHASKTGDLLFGTDITDTSEVMARYRVALNQLERLSADDEPKMASSIVVEVWKGHEWLEQSELEVCATHLKLLVIASSIPPLIGLAELQDNVAQILRHLLKFIRDRSHVPEIQVLLYLSTITNIVNNLGSNTQHLNAASFMDENFFERVLLYSRRRQSTLLSLTASKALWVLLAAFKDHSMILKSMRIPLTTIDEDQKTKTSPGVTNGVEVLLANITMKITTKQAIEADASALSILFDHDIKCAGIFFVRYRYSIIAKFIGDLRPSLGLGRQPRDSAHVKPLGDPRSVLHYDVPVAARERDMIRLCLLAKSCLVAGFKAEIAKSSENTAPHNEWATKVDEGFHFNLKEEIPRTKTAVIPLLDHLHPIVVNAAVQCLLVHLSAQPQHCVDLVDPVCVGKLLAFSLDRADYPPLQASSIAAVRAILSDASSHIAPYQLPDKLFSCQNRLVACLRSLDFDVTKQAVELMSLLLSKNENKQRYNHFAELFRDPENQASLSKAFNSLCGESRRNGDAAGILQRLVGFVIQLDLARLVDSGALVDALTQTISCNRDQAFLRPMACSCLHDIVIQGGKASHFAKKSRLRAIVSLLHGSLTNGEAGHILSILCTAAVENSGIRQYLSSSESSCMPGIARILNSFSRISTGGGSSISQLVGGANVDDDELVAYEKARKSGLLSYDGDERHAIRVATTSQVVISLYTDNVYEECLNLLVVLLKPYQSVEERYGCMCDDGAANGCHDCDPCDLLGRVHGPRLVARLLLSRRVHIHMDDTNQRILEAPGVEASTIVYRAVCVLQTLSRTRQCRINALRGSISSSGWWSILWLAERSKPSIVEQTGMLGEVSATALVTLSQFCAEPDVSDFVLSQREFIIHLFMHISSTREDAHSTRCRRAATFFIARLAEKARIVRDVLFQDRVATLLANPRFFQDRISRANILILCRNLRKFDRDILDTVVSALSEEIACADFDSIMIQLLCDVMVRFLVADMNNANAGPSGASNPLAITSQLALTFHIASAPVWRSIVSSFSDDDGSGGFRVVMEVAQEVASRIWPGDKSLESFLGFLFEQHLRMDFVPQVKAAPISGADQDDSIEDADMKSCLTNHPLSLQYVTTAGEQNAPAISDRSFAGSEALWRFVQLLWRVCDQQSSPGRNIRVPIPFDRIVSTFKRWTTYSSACCASSTTSDRRQRFLGFVSELLRTHPDYCSQLRMPDVVRMVETFATQSGVIGVGYELLYLLCKSEPLNGAILVKQVRQTPTSLVMPCSPSRASPLLNKPALPSLHLMWSAARPTYFCRAVPFSRLTTKSNRGLMYVLEPSMPPVSFGTPFAIALLHLVSDNQPSVLLHYLQSQSIFALLELLLLTTDKHGSHKKTQHSLIVCLLGLLEKCVALEPSTVLFFSADPRLLQTVVSQVFAVKTSTQTAAITLLLELIRRIPPFVDHLLRLEDWESSVSTVKSWTIDYMQDRLSRLRQATLNRKEVVELAHLIQVPVFAAAKTVELARLSVAFMESRLVESDHFMVLAGEGHFSDCPEWMCGHSKHPVTRKRNAFSSTVERKRASGVPVLVYKMQKDWYFGSSGSLGRSEIVRNISSYQDRNMEPHGHSGWLISRLCRFLLEDRAELLRRVSYTRNISNTDLMAKMRGRWHDTLDLLSALPLFDGVSRDSLACLTLAMGEPRMHNLAELELRYNGVLPLLLVHCDQIKFDLQVSYSNTEADMSGELRRGDLIGFSSCPTDAVNQTLQTRITTKPKLVRVSVLEDAALCSNLSPSELALLSTRCQHGFQSVTTMAQELCSSAISRSCTAKLQSRRRLQVQSLHLIQLLIANSPSYADTMSRNSKALGTVFEVARSSMDLSVIDAAIDIIAAVVGLDWTFSTLRSYNDWDEQNWIQFSCSLITARLEGERSILKPLKLLRSAAESIPSNDRFRLLSDVPSIAAAAFRNLLQPQLTPHGDSLIELVQLTHELSRDSNEMMEVCIANEVHVLIARTLILFGGSLGPTTLRQLLELVVIFNELPQCRLPLHRVLLVPEIVGTLQVVTGNLLMLIKAFNLSTESDQVAHIRFFSVISQHLTIVRQTNDQPTCLDSAITLFAAVLLSNFSSFCCADHILLDVVARFCEAVPKCVDMASKCHVYAHNRVFAFHRYIFVTFSRLQSSRSGIVGSTEREVVDITRCIRVFCGVEKCANYFLRHEYIDIAFRYLALWPDNDFLDGSARVWIELLHSLEVIATSHEQILARVLHSQATRLKLFHKRLAAALMNDTVNMRLESADLLERVLAALLDMVSASFTKIEISGKSFHDLTWLVTDIAVPCVRWIERKQIDIPQTLVCCPRDALQLASLRFLSSVCASPSMMPFFVTMDEFPRALEVISTRMVDESESDIMRERLVYCVCSAVEYYAALASREDISSAVSYILRQVHPSVMVMCDQESRSCQAQSQALDYALRLVWLMCFLDRNQSNPTEDARVDLIAVITMLSRVLGVMRSRSTVVFLLGCLSAVVRATVDRNLMKTEISVQMAGIVSQLLDWRAKNPLCEVTETETNQEVGWEFFSCAKRDRTASSLDFAQKILILAVIRRIVTEASLTTAWLSTDPELRKLTNTGLPLSLSLLTFRTTRSPFMLSVQKKCILFLCNSVTQARLRSPPMVVLAWQRAIRQAHILQVVSGILKDAALTLSLASEAIKFLLVLVTESVVDCHQIVRVFAQSDVNLLRDAVFTATRFLECKLTIDCLEFLAAAGRASVRAAKLAARALEAVPVFDNIIFGIDVAASNQWRVVGAMFRCYRALCHVWSVQDCVSLWELVMRQFTGDDSPDGACFADGLQLLEALTKRSVVKTQRLLPGKFWQRLHDFVTRSGDNGARQAVNYMCSVTLRNQAATFDLWCQEALNAVFRQNLLTGDEISVRFCTEALSHPSIAFNMAVWTSERLASFSSAPLAEQLGLVGVLPMMQALKHLTQTGSILEKTWCAIRDAALSWNNDEDAWRRCCALTATRSLIAARQLRPLHTEASAFRKVCVRWRDRYVGFHKIDSPSPMRQGGERESSMGVLLLVDICLTLGFSVDQDAALGCICHLWRTNVVLTDPRPLRASSSALSALSSFAVDNDGHVKPILARDVVQDGLGVLTILSRVAYGQCHEARNNWVDAKNSRRLILALLRTSTSAALARGQLTRPAFDAIDRASWILSHFETCTRHQWAVAECEVLTLLCIEARLSERILRRRTLNQWIFNLTYGISRDDFLRSKCVDDAFVALAAAALRHENFVIKGQELLANNLKPLVLRTTMAIVSDRLDHGQFRSLPLELLAILIQLDSLLLQELWQVCLLSTPARRSVVQGTILRALTDPLGDAVFPQDRRHAAFLAYGLATSLRKATPLICARVCSRETELTEEDKVPSFCDLLTTSLYNSSGTSIRHTVRVSSNELSTPSSMFPLVLTFTASDTAAWTLRTLQKCLRDKNFTRVLWGEVDLFDQVFASLASPNAEVSSASAWVLRDAIMLHSTQKQIADVNNQLPSRNYRQLAYFDDIQSHEAIFSHAPSARATSVPTSFTVVALWIHFYAKHSNTLMASVDARIHLEAVEEVALFMVTRCFQQIFATESNQAERDIIRSARSSHTTLCASLMLIATTPPVDEMRRVRVLSLQVLAALCAYSTTAYSVDYFVDEDHMERLLLLVEESKSTAERLAVLKLIRELTLVGVIKILFGTSSSKLLVRLLRWLVDPQNPELQPCATAILRQLVTKSGGATFDGDPHTRKQALSHQQRMLVTIANALFTDESGTQADPDKLEHTGGSILQQPQLTATFVARLDCQQQHASATTSVILHFRVLSRSGKALREFRHRGKLRIDRPIISRKIILEPLAEMIYCDVVVGISESSSIKPEVHQLRLGVGANSHNDVAEIVVTSPSGTGSLYLHASHDVSGIDHQGRGILGRLLRDPKVSPQSVADAVAIVSELAKNQEIFCRSDIGLNRHILAVIEAIKRLQGCVDLSPLNALTAWFWGNRNSVANFRSSWEPLLQLVQLMRTSPLMVPTPVSMEPIHSNSDKISSGPTFLLSLMEWLATLESDSLTENCINVLFFECTDTLMALASHFFPSRTTRASFFHLIATVVRVNSLHCEVFARKHAVKLLSFLIDSDQGDSRAEMLQHAARVVAKIARSDVASDKFVRHRGLELFSHIAYSVFCESTWNSISFHSRSAADNVVLACAFLSEIAANGVAIPQSSESQKLLVGKLITRGSRRQLSIIETLLMFLTRNDPTKESTTPPTSFERLAAVILRAWIEKWPNDSFDFEQKLILAAETTARECNLGDVASLANRYASGVRRCIELTEWDYLSELNTVKTSYSAAISSAARTGVIPLTCRTPFIPFDKEVLYEQRKKLLDIDHCTRESVSNQLREVLGLVSNHPEIVRTLEVIRKQRQMTRIKSADMSARLAVAMHGVLVVVYDSYVDTLASLLPTTVFPPEMDARKAATTVLGWLMLLEQICNLLCCAFEEHDPVFYAESFRQLHVLLTKELPSFLLKTERVLPREEAVHMQLNNLERQLRQLTNKHELRGVTSEGEDVVQKAELLLVEFSQTKRKVSAVLALALASHDSVERIRRCIVAAEYVWRRAFGYSNDTVADFMAGTKESESLWAKIGSYAQAIKMVMVHPVPIMKRRWQKLTKLLSSLLHILDSKGEEPTVLLAESQVDDYIYDNERETDAEKLAHDEDRKLLRRLQLRASSELLVSRVPFTSLESLLDHYGFASLGFKKQISLLNFSELRSSVTLAFKAAIEVKRKNGEAAPVVEGMSASQLERELTHLQGVALRGEPTGAESFARYSELLHDLQAIVDASDLGVHLRIVVPRPMQVSLWQLVLASVRRTRLYSALHQLEQMCTTPRSILEDVLRERRALLVDQGALTDSPTKVRSKSKIFSESVAWLSDAHSGHLRSKRRAAVAVDASHDDPFVRLVTMETDSVVNNPRVLDDPFSDENLVSSLKRSLREQRDKPAPWYVLYLRRMLPRASRYVVSAKTSVRLRRVRRRVALVALLLAFWRQEELENDLTNEVLARAFSSQAEREDYFLRLHLAKARSELIRVWMPESGSLGLPLWQWPSYFIVGTIVCVLMSSVGPYVSSSNPHERNRAMTYATYVLVLLVFALSAKSMHKITQKHFVLQERNRLRLEPLGKYYQNVQALVMILVEIVQLNSITFDPKFNWNDTDQIPKLIQWLGELGISQIGIAQVELKAALCAASLVFWLVMLKCANKFQETSPFLNRLFTKDLPSLLNSTLYMGFLSTFFSFLSCVDCQGTYGDKFDKCKDLPPPPPFLLSHQNIACWTTDHAPYALLGLWGVTFFLPIGILAQGMNQVLFQQEEVDIKYAPVVLLFTQLIKAIAASARAFFTFDTTLLASVALVGNVLLLGILTLRPSKTKGASLWYIQYVKSGIYAASGWSAACAIYRVETKASSSISNNLVYLGWLAIGGVTAICVRVEAWRRNEQREHEDAAHAGSQRSLSITPPSDPTLELTSVERNFIRESMNSARTRKLTAQVLQRAAKLADDEPPELHAFMQRARAYAANASGGPATVTEAVFMHNARKLTRKIDHNIRRRGTNREQAETTTYD